MKDLLSCNYQTEKHNLYLYNEYVLSIDDFREKISLKRYQYDNWIIIAVYGYSRRPYILTPA